MDATRFSKKDWVCGSAMAVEHDLYAWALPVVLNRGKDTSPRNCTSAEHHSGLRREKYAFLRRNRRNEAILEISQRNFSLPGSTSVGFREVAVFFGLRSVECN
eukprot:1999583-Amphidinium_carterae.1